MYYPRPARPSVPQENLDHFIGINALSIIRSLIYRQICLINHQRTHQTLDIIKPKHPGVLIRPEQNRLFRDQLVILTFAQFSSGTVGLESISYCSLHLADLSWPIWCCFQNGNKEKIYNIFKCQRNVVERSDTGVQTEEFGWVLVSL